MFTRWLKALTLVLALSFAATLPAQAQGKGQGHGRGHSKVRANDRRVTFSTPRRVRRGRNMTPGVRRGSINSKTTIIGTRRRNSAGAAVALEHGRGHGRARVRN